MKTIFLILLLVFPTVFCFPQYPVIKGVQVQVKFDRKIRDWDGFGFNYVETAQTPDYHKFPQEYGGFSLLDKQEKSEIIDLIFGEDGLKAGYKEDLAGYLVSWVKFLREKEGFPVNYVSLHNEGED